MKDAVNIMGDLGWRDNIMVLAEPTSLIDALRNQRGGILIMPGGRDKPYQECLAGEGVETTKEFVARGGSYLGICAGAYLA